MVIAIDFDGTICDTHLEHGMMDAKGYPPPMPGAREAISLLREKGHLVYIHSCNNPGWIDKWMAYHDIRFDGIADEKKPVAAFYIDDRAIRFVSWNQAIEDLKMAMSEMSKLG